MVKKGVFFSLDALIAAIIIFAALIMVPVFYIKKEQAAQQVYFSSDLIQLISTMKIGDMGDPAIKTLLDDNNITDLNKTLIEQILRFTIEGDEEEAEELLSLVTGGLLPGYYNFGIWIEGYDDPIFASSQKPVSQLISSKQMVSGIERGRATEGLTSRALLSSISERTSSTYTYFGGYVGDGNITKKITLPDSISSVSSAYMELDINGNFDFYINGIFVDSFIPQNLNTSIDSWDIGENLTLFNPGNNTIEFRFHSNTSSNSIGGGYFKVVYTSSDIILTQNETEVYRFPGIKGVINLYDSFYVPGALQSIKAHLHYYNDYNLFFNIGNETIYRDMDSDGEYTVDLYDSNFSALDYPSLSQKTIPLRLGTEAFELMKKAYNADVILITDLSGSMRWRLDNSNTGTIRGCSSPQLYDPSTRRISLAKCLNKDFIDLIMNASGNRMGLVGFSSSAHTYTPNLEYTNEQLISHINGYSDSPSGGTCICCAINRAHELLSDSLYAMAILLPKKSSWLYNPSYPLTLPPDDQNGNNWTSIDYNDSIWSTGSTILGFEKTAYTPYVDTDIESNSVILSNNSYSASEYFLISQNIAAGGLSDTYAQDSNTLDLVYTPAAVNIFYDGFETYYGDGSHQIDGNDINQAPGHWYIDDTGEEVFIMANNGAYPAYAGTDVLVFRDMDSYGYAETTIDLSAYTNPKLSYWWRLGPNGFDTGEYANVRVWDGTWNTVATYDSDDDDNTYHYAEIDLSSYNRIANFKIRFGARSSWNDERFYIDEVTVREEGEQPEIWLNSTGISYSKEFSKVEARLVFKSNSSVNYAMKIYNFNTNIWETNGCDSGDVIADSWNDFWCSKTNPLDYISYDDKIRVALAGSGSKALTTNIDLAEFYTSNVIGNYYFRKHFEIDDKNAFLSARLYVLSDDNAEIYLNSNLIDNDTTGHNAEYWNRYKDINISYLEDGDNVFAVKLHNKDNRSAKFDLQLEVNSSRQRYILVMSDGIASYSCGGCGSGCSGTCTSTSGSYDCGGGSGDCSGSQCDTAINDAICASCNSHDELNATVYSIGFGPVSECYNANRTLRSIAACGGGSYYASSDADELKDIYKQIAEKILSATYQAQFINVTGLTISPSTLYPDSYIELKYTPASIQQAYGLIPLTIESERFGNTLTQGSFYIPDNFIIHDAKLTSYSGDKWTDKASIKDDSGNWVNFYNLSEYGSNYQELGDPYMVNIPIGLILNNKNNNVSISTAINPLNTTGGSPDDRVIYTAGIGIDVNYTGIFEKAEGCNWNIKFEDNTEATIPLPSTYDGIKDCTFDENTDCDIEYGNDAITNTVCHLFKQLDFDSDGRLFVKFGPGDLDIEIYSTGKNIPYMWGPTIVEVRVWK